jgi:phage repressor protein C with HTH and peptisase S24 domain
LGEGRRLRGEFQQRLIAIQEENKKAINTLPAQFENKFLRSSTDKVYNCINNISVTLLFVNKNRNKVNTISEVIEKIKKMKGIKTKEQVYELLGTTRNSIFNRQRRNKFPYQEIVTYCLREDMDINEILTNRSSAAQPKIRPIRSGSIPTEQEESSDQEGYVFVPKYDVQVSAGQVSLIHSEQIVSHLAFQENWIRQELGIDPNHIVLIQAVGDSMNPTFNAGALLLVNTKVNEIKNDSIYVINRDDELIVKRIQDLWNGQIKIKSDNPKYEPLIIQKTDALKIVGEVVWVGQKN